MLQVQSWETTGHPPQQHAIQPADLPLTSLRPITCFKAPFTCEQVKKLRTKNLPKSEA